VTKAFLKRPLEAVPLSTEPDVDGVVELPPPPPPPQAVRMLDTASTVNKCDFISIPKVCKGFLVFVPHGAQKCGRDNEGDILRERTEAKIKAALKEGVPHQALDD
jgi:hypothetical protein